MRVTLHLSGSASAIGGNIRTVEIGAQPFRIGRGSDCDWVVSDEQAAISRQHCELYIHGSDLVITDSSSNGTFLGSESNRLVKGQPTAVPDTTTLLIGGARIDIEVDRPGAGRGAEPEGFGLDGAPSMDDPFGVKAGGGPAPARDAGDPFDLLGDGGASAGADEDPFFKPEPQNDLSLTDAPPPVTPDMGFAPAAGVRTPDASAVPDDWMDDDDGDPFDDLEAQLDDLGGGGAGPDLGTEPVAPPPQPAAAPPPPQQPAPPPVQQQAAPPPPPPPPQAQAPADDPFGLNEQRSAAAQRVGPPRQALSLDPPDPQTAPPSAQAPAPGQAPPQHPAAAPPPQPQAAQPQAAPQQSDEVARAFFHAMGMRLEDIPPEKRAERAAEMGRLFRAMADGYRVLLLSRRDAKIALGVRSSQVEVGMNPLKWAPDASAAVDGLLQDRSGSYKRGEEAIEDAVLSLQQHQMALIAGVKESLKIALGAFDPKTLEKKITSRGISKVIGAMRRAELWDRFVENYAEFAHQADDDIRIVLGRELDKIYSSAGSGQDGQGGGPLGL